MRISFNQTSSANVRDTNGYGYAAKMCKEALAELGHEVNWRDSTADVEINFIQPDHWHWSGVDYRIGYLPWESTELHEGWLEKMNEVDEVWTPSPVIAQWYVDAGVTRPVYVYEHGVEALWTPYQRPVDERFRVLHHGAEALRKGGNEIIRAFQDTLWEEDATLVMKMTLNQFQVHDTDHVHIKKERVPIEQLVELYHSCHLFCYPSWGEGFGLTPLQAAATGMPVLITKGWAPYERYLPEESLISSALVDSPWQHHHPGKMFKPDEEELRYKLRWHFENREKTSSDALELSETIRKDYDWLTLTERAFAHLL
jgi:glycosyltransferase involved in cell wall biosynthesis